MWMVGGMSRQIDFTISYTSFVRKIVLHCSDGSCYGIASIRSVIFLSRDFFQFSQRGLSPNTMTQIRSSSRSFWVSLFPIRVLFFVTLQHRLTQPSELSWTQLHVVFY